MTSALPSKTSTFNPGFSGILASGRFLKTRALLWGSFLFVLALAFFFASVLGAGWIGLTGYLFYLPAIVVPLLACWIYAILVRRIEEREVWELQIGLPMLSEIPLGFLLGSAFIGGMWLVLLSLKLYSAHRGIWTDWFGDLLFDSYISAVLEELAFRAILLRIFARLWGAPAGVILSSILFGLAHFTHGSWLGILGIIINAGIAMGLLYVMTDHLWLSIGMHLGYDFIETSILGVGSNHGLLVSRPKADAAAWLTGGAFGPDAAIPAMIFGLAVNLVLWRIAFKTRAASLLRPTPQATIAG